MTIQPERIALDDLTSDALDQLYARIDTLEYVAAGNKRHVQLLVPELEQAEAAIARVRALATQWAVFRAYGSAATELRAALDQPQQPTTTAGTGTSTRCSCGRPDPGPCTPCPSGPPQPPLRLHLHTHGRHTEEPA
ncbi:hypothetical protein AB0L80_43085 [Streptomyces sp. NPDC052069]|uniref:hypothetical protein n=1 Tax=Streptomyces sp. NPDC052069 TaxID=3154650 RepID=UPI00342B0F38